jgi:hypothetical protein
MILFESRGYADKRAEPWLRAGPRLGTGFGLAL